jgi:hypothetical protein
MVRLWTALSVFVVATAFFGTHLETRPSVPEERQMTAASRALLEQSGRDDRGRLIPLFVSATPGVWLTPVPLYAVVLVTKIWPSGNAQSRVVAALAGAADVMLMFAISAQWFESMGFGLIAALLLLVNPAHFVYSRTATLNGIWQLPMISCWLLGLLMMRRNPAAAPRYLAVSTVALVATVYSQPSAALMVPLFAIVTVVVARRTGLTSWRDLRPACIGAAVTLMPLLLWFAIYPSTYTDTFGRWFLLAAHLRNPVAWVRALTNWHMLTVWSELFWDFFSPSNLMTTAAAANQIGLFSASITALVILGAAQAIHQVLGNRLAGNMNDVALVGMVIAPFASAMFQLPRPIDYALVTVVFGTLLATAAIQSLWSRHHWTGRVVAIAVLLAATTEFWREYGRLVQMA